MPDQGCHPDEKSTRLHSDIYIHRILSFDVIGDTLRGTRGIMLDIYRHPEELIEARERLTPFMIKPVVASCKASGHIMPFIPLHKGADGFMSDEQFLKYYWPTLRKLIIGLVNKRCVPQLFAEDKYNQRPFISPKRG